MTMRVVSTTTPRHYHHGFIVLIVMILVGREKWQVAAASVDENSAATATSVANSRNDDDILLNDDPSIPAVTKESSTAADTAEADSKPQKVVAGEPLQDGSSNSDDEAAESSSNSDETSDSNSDTTTATDDNDPNDNDNDSDDTDDSELHQAVLQETLAAGRGRRDEPGVRDQWASTEHLSQKYDSRRPPSARVQRLLEQYRIVECLTDENGDGNDRPTKKDKPKSKKHFKCTHDEAVQKINAFIQQAKQDAQAQEAQRQAGEFYRRMLRLGLSVVAGAAGLYTANRYGNDLTRRILGEDGGTTMNDDDHRALRAAAAAKRMNDNNNTDDNDTSWTPLEQEQFQTALDSIDDGVPKLVRYTLIAAKVKTKTAHQCQAYHEEQMRLHKQLKKQ